VPLPPWSQPLCEASIPSTQHHETHNCRTEKTRLCSLYSSPVNWYSFSSDVINHRHGGSTAGSVYYLPSIYLPFLIPFISGPRQRPSLIPGSNSASRIEAGHRGDDEKKQEGRATFDMTIALIDSGQVEEYGDTSATYWNLYLSEAEINDKNLVESLEGDTKSMELVVSQSTSPLSHCNFLLSPYRTLYSLLLSHHLLLRFIRRSNLIMASRT
jgi:hypothetical protein